MTYSDKTYLPSAHTGKLFLFVIICKLVFIKWIKNPRKWCYQRLREWQTVFIISIFFGTCLSQTVNLPVIQIIAMKKRISFCLLLTLADRFYRHPSVSGMCKSEEANTYGANDAEVSKGNGKLFYLYLFYTFHQGLHRQ